MKSDNLIQISGYLPNDAFINDKETFASFTSAQTKISTSHSLTSTVWHSLQTATIGR